MGDAGTVPALVGAMAHLRFAYLGPGMIYLTLGMASAVVAGLALRDAALRDPSRGGASRALRLALGAGMGVLGLGVACAGLQFLRAAMA